MAISKILIDDHFPEEWWVVRVCENINKILDVGFGIAPFGKDNIRTKWDRGKTPPCGALEIVIAGS